MGKLTVFSLHASSVSEKRLSLVPNGNVRYQLKTPYRAPRGHDLGPQRLKRVFNIDTETCRARGGAVKVIACI